MVGVRSSKYRHVYGDPVRKDKSYDNIRLTQNAFDANLAKSNGKYISLNWEASGGGSFAVIPTAEQGKLPDRFPLFDGHRGPVLDTDWNPFDDEMVVSSSDDGTIGIWRVPDDFSVHQEYAKLDDCRDIAPVKFLEGHGKKVGHVAFNPVAENVLASASLDNTIKIWNVETGKVLFTLKHPAFVTSFDWSYDGTKIISVAKDKQLRVWDVRAEKILTEGPGHRGSKGSRVTWLGDNDRFLTTGFSIVSDREMALWDSNDVKKGPIGGFRGLDPSSGIVIPHFDPMTSVVYLGGRGDGKIVYYEYADDTLYDLFAYNSTSPQRGLGWVPNRSLDPHGHEVARVYKVHETLIEAIPFRIPLKNEGFLDNVYTYVEAGKPALTAEEWAGGKTARPLVKDWKTVYDGVDATPKEAPKRTEASAAQPEEQKPPKSGASPKKDDVKTAAKGDSKDANKDDKSEAKPKGGADAKAEDPATKLDAKRADAEKNLAGASKATKDEQFAALSKAEKQDSYDVLQSKEVKSFLDKNTQEGPEEESDHDSAWDEDASAAFPAKKESKLDAEPKSGTEAEPKAEPKTKAGPKTKAEPKSKTEPKSKAEPKSKEDSKSKEETKSDAKAETESSKLGEPWVHASLETADTPPETTTISLGEAARAAAGAPRGSAAVANASSKLDTILEKLDDLSARIAKLEAAQK